MRQRIAEYAISIWAVGNIAAILYADLNHIVGTILLLVIVCFPLYSIYFGNFEFYPPKSESFQFYGAWGLFFVFEFGVTFFLSIVVACQLGGMLPNNCQPYWRW